MMHVRSLSMRPFRGTTIPTLLRLLQLLLFSIAQLRAVVQAAESAGCGGQHEGWRLRGGSVYERTSLIEINPDYVPPPHLVANGAKSRATTFVPRPYSPLSTPTGGSSRQPVLVQDVGSHGSDPVFRRDMRPHPSVLVETASLSFEQMMMYQPRMSPPERMGLVEILASVRQRNGPSLTNTALSCLGVFVLWQIPACRPTLGRWFVCSQSNPLLAVVLSSVSHANLSHLLFNLAALFGVGGPVRNALAQTQWPLWPLLLGASVSGSVFHLLLGTTRHVAGCMGLSDVTMALLAVYAKLFPHQNLGIFVLGIIPVRMRASQLLSAVAVWSCVGILLARVKAPTTNVGHAAHLGGIVFGLAYYEAWLRRREWQPLLSNLVKRYR